MVNFFNICIKIVFVLSFLRLKYVLSKPGNFFIKEFSYYEKYNITVFKASIKAFVDKDGVTSKQSLKVYCFLWYKKASFEIRKHETFEKIEYIKYSFKRFKEMEFEYPNQSFYT